MNTPAPGAEPPSAAAESEPPSAERAARPPDTASTSGRAPRPIATSWFDSEDAPARAALNSCIHCGLCLTACPTYRELKIEPDSPRGRLHLMRGLSEGRIAPSDPLLQHLDQCIGCRACETVCPAGVPYGQLLEASRGQLARRAAKSSALRSIGEWALRSLLPHRGRMHLAADLLRFGQRGPIAAIMNSGWATRTLPGFMTRGFRMTPLLEPRRERGLEHTVLPRGARLERRPDAWVFHPAGTPRANVSFFTTCVMEVMQPRINRTVVRLLLLSGCRVAVPLAQSCCGALQAHAGLRRTAKRQAQKNLRAFAADSEPIVTASAGCGAALREVSHLLDDASPEAAHFSSRIRDVSETLAEHPLPEPQALTSNRETGKPLRVAYHDPCHLAHGQRIRSQPRALLERLPGIELVELENSDWCCGSGGVYNLTHPEMADRQLEHKLDSVERAEADWVVASNPGCQMHMARGAVERRLAARMVHLVEVLEQAYPEPPPGAAS